MRIRSIAFLCILFLGIAGMLTAPGCVSSSATTQQALLANTQVESGLWATYQTATTVLTLAYEDGKITPAQWTGKIVPDVLAANAAIIAYHNLYTEATSTTQPDPATVAAEAQVALTAIIEIGADLKLIPGSSGGSPPPVPLPPAGM